MTSSESTSTEATTTEAIPLSEHSRLLLEIHRAMRADGQRLIAAVESMASGDTDRAARLGGTFSIIVKLIHTHHWTEDDVLYPFLIARVPGFEGDAIRLEDDHIELDAAMARVNGRFRLLAHPLSPRLRDGTQDQLVTEVVSFNDVLIGHLDREEAVVVPAVDSALPPGDVETLSEAALKHSKLHDLSMSVPWLMANVTPEEEADLRAGAPRLLRVLHDHVWERRFHQLMEPLYGPAGP